jgi:multiple sugar transport system ATP-binding protein
LEAASERGTIVRTSDGHRQRDYTRGNHHSTLDNQRAPLKHTNMARVVIDNLTKTFEGPGGEIIRAVDSASLAVEDKEFMVLVGPSGCGKTTTLRLIAGLEEVTSGTISVDGTVINEIPPGERDIAMVFQNHALYPHMTVHENMAFGLKLRKYGRAEIEQRVGEAAEILGLNDCLKRKPEALSGGQRQRVAVGRAIVRKPKVFLFDEPFSNLDVPMRAQMRREISQLHQRLATTMIYVTHDQVEAMTMGDRIAVMQRGVIQQVAAPVRLYDQPENLFVAGFIGSPPMNFFRGTLAQNGGGMIFQTEAGGEKGFNLQIENEMNSRLANQVGKKLVLGLHPENIMDKSRSPDSPVGWTVEAIAEKIEPLGAETHLYAASGADSFVVRLPAGWRAEAKQKVPLVFDMRQAHFFDADTGRKIG